MTHENWLLKRACLSPRKLALVFEGESWNFAQLYEESLKYSAVIQHTLGLKASAIRKNQRVGVLANNSAVFYFTILGLMHLGIEMVLLNTRLSEQELLYQVQDAQLDTLFYSEDMAEKAMAVATQAEKSLEGAYVLEAIGAEAQTATCDDVLLKKEFALNRVMSILYTSGTTGNPKGVMQSYGNHYASAVAGALNAGVAPNDAWICVTPLYHISGLSILVRSLVYGMPVYLFRKFHAPTINRHLLKGEGTIISVVAYTLSALLEDLGDRTYPESLRYMLLGGGFFAESLLTRAKEKGAPIIRSFGMTETCSQIIATGLEDTDYKIGASGKALFPNQLRIGNGQLPAHEVGEIQVKSPALCVGYLNLAEKYRTSFTDDGWYKTGDVGLLDEEGYLYVKSRLADLIISGGENIYPAEVEQALLHHPAIAEAAVVGKADATWGYVPWAFLVLKEGATAPSDEELSAFCQKELARYKCPKAFVWLKALPKTSIGKIQKYKLLADSETAEKGEA